MSNLQRFVSCRLNVAGFAAMRRCGHLVILACVLMLACETTDAKPIRGSWTGALVDQTCFLHAAKKNDLSLLEGHQRSCIMKCAKEGKSLGMIVNGMYYGFNPIGEKLAWRLLQASQNPTTIGVIVTGTLSQNIIAVKTMKLQ